MFADPKNNLQKFGLSPGSVVVDIGAGSGHYALEAAKMINGAGGKVYAIDVQKDLLEKLKNEALKEKLDNVEIIWGDAEKPSGTKLANNMADVVILSNILFQVEDKRALAIEVSRILKSKGRALLIDWSDSFGGIGPKAESVFSEKQAKTFFESNGFKVDQSLEVGSHHYGLVLRKK